MLLLSPRMPRPDPLPVGAVGTNPELQNGKVVMLGGAGGLIERGSRNAPTAWPHQAARVSASFFASLQPQGYRLARSLGPAVIDAGFIRA
jgi:hypothetical protein